MAHAESIEWNLEPFSNGRLPEWMECTHVIQQVDRSSESVYDEITYQMCAVYN